MEKKGGFNDRLLNQSSWLVGTLILGLLVTTATATAAEKGKGKVEAQSMDDLFGDPAPEAKQPAKKTESIVPTGNMQDKSTVAAPAAVVPEVPALGQANANLKQSATAPQQFTGFYQNDLAYTYADKKHWSRFNNTLDLSTKGRTAGGVAWTLGGRVNYDPIYDLTDYYPSEVRKDQRFEAMIREAYADFSAGDLDFRVGRQHIVWGEMVGLFFADVVSAKDMRQFILPDFDMIRIPQWAARAEYFKEDFHAEAVWIPYMSYDNIGKPGSEFYPLNPPAVAGFQTVIASEKQPTGLNDGAYGARLSYIKGGWDVSGFYYTANDPSAAFARQVVLMPTQTITYEPIHKRIHQIGGTLGKDLGPMLLKAEVIYTKDKLFSTTNTAYADGLVKQDMLDYVVGLEWSFPKETRFNMQLFQRWFPDHDAGIVPHTTESGVSILLSTQALHPKLEPELLLIRSLNRKDWSAQLKVTWKVDGNWRLAAGADIFEGPPTGLFGQYNSKDRVYTEARYSF